MNGGSAVPGGIGGFGGAMQGFNGGMDMPGGNGGAAGYRML